MTDDELELRILGRFVAQHKVAALSGQTGKCAAELDMRSVVQELTGLQGDELAYEARRWYLQLVRKPQPSGKPAPLRPCSDTPKLRGEHQHHARAFMLPAASPAWDRIRELEDVVARSRSAAPARERDQKFGVLWSPGQATADFATWTDGAGSGDFSVGVIFLDIDAFKSLNGRFGEPQVDRDLLTPFQEFLERLVRHRGHAYRYGGDEFVLLLPNHTAEEMVAFAERLRTGIASQPFDVDGQTISVTVSIGIARFPDHGDTYDAVLDAASLAKNTAKGQGKDQIVLAPGR